MNKNEFISPAILVRSDAELYVDRRSHTIQFAIWVSKQPELMDFWCMSDDAQQHVYEQFIKETKKNNMRFYDVLRSIENKIE